MSSRLSSIASDLCELGEKIDDVHLVKKMLHVIPKQYRLLEN
jgi:hypothetical protein